MSRMPLTTDRASAAVSLQLPVDDERFLHLLTRLFGGLPAPRDLAARWDAATASIAEALERRARRRRARFDLFLREAAPAHVADLALAVRAQQGNADAVVEIRRLLQPVVVARVHGARLGWNEDELVHDALGRIFDKLGSYRGGASLRTWGGRVTQNYLLNWLRDSRTRQRVEVPLETGPGGEERTVPGDAAASPERSVLHDERAERLARLAGELARLAAAALAPDEWELVLQVVIDGTPYQEIGTRTGVKPATLRVRLFRAVAKLRATALAANGPEFGRVVLDALAEA